MLDKLWAIIFKNFLEIFLEKARIFIKFSMEKYFRL